MSWADTGRAWVSPSPNLRSAEAALVYPGTALLEGTNASEGRGTDAPFLLIGLLVLLLKRDRPAKLVVLWLVLYPVGASLMNEIPSASRGFIGVAMYHKRPDEKLPD